MMSKRFYLGASSVAIVLLISIGAFLHFTRETKKTVYLYDNQDSSVGENVQKTEEADGFSLQQRFSLSGWLPYWGKEAGAADFEKNADLFSEIDPFAFGVDQDGRLSDPMRIGNEPWSGLQKVAQEKNVAIVPTVIWADAQAMHQVFSDPQRLNSHVENISTMLSKNNFSGIDIDYEGKDAADRNLFTSFLRTLRQKLGPEGRKISCTVEARTQDDPPDGWTGTRAMSFANDYSALNELCDSVKIMAYDQMFQTNGEKKIFDDTNETPSAPNADIHWAESVMRYAMRYIDQEKLVLGVPTYGWEFTVEKTSTGHHYERVKSVSYPEAMEKAAKDRIGIERTSGGEPFFIYRSADGKHIVTFSDAESVRQKMELAKKLGLKGISLFKIDGQSDPKIFSVMEEEMAK